MAHRLSVAGHTGAMPFDRAALHRIHKLARGVPRRINLLCDRALLGAYVEGRSTVSRRIVDRAAAEVFDLGPAPRRRRPGWALGLAFATGAVVLAAVGGLAWQAQRGGTPFTSWGAAKASAASGSGRQAARAPASAASSGTAMANAASSVASAASSAAPPASSGATAALPTASAVLATAPARSGASEPNRSSTAMAAAAAPWPQFDAATDLALLPRDERTLWRELASAWTVELPAGDPCTPTPKQPLRCYRTSNATLALVQRFDRPGLISLVDPQGRTVHARLVGLNSHSAQLAAGQRQWTVPLAQLAGLWRGEYATFWRPPAGYAKPLGDGAGGPAVQALAAGLARERHEPAPPPGAVLDAPLRARLAAFQLAQGLTPDGLAGPTTFMLLNRALGVAEPRLSAE